jgi:hypothetical protein
LAAAAIAASRTARWRPIACGGRYDAMVGVVTMLQEGCQRDARGLARAGVGLSRLVCSGRK